VSVVDWASIMAGTATQEQIIAANIEAREQARQERADAYVALCSDFRRWSHAAAIAILNMRGVSSVGAHGAPVWPLVYRKAARIWWASRGVPVETADRALRSLQPVVRRQFEDNDVLDGRDVVSAWRAAHGAVVRASDCGCKRARGKGFVYVMAHQPYADRFKVGKTSQPIEKRARALSMQAGFRVEPLCVAAFCCYAFAGFVEQRVHAFWDDRREIGEWFCGDASFAAKAAESVLGLARKVCVYETRVFASNGLREVVEQRIAHFDK
jgi:hypothetical protein